MTLKLENGNCLELMKTLPDKSIDLFICDLPYGETNCKWDCKIDLEQFWIQFKRLRKTKKVACIHFCSSKFGYTLIKSNEKMFKMDMVWVKRNKTGGLQSRHRPMRNHEMVYFFYEQAPKYNRDKYHKRIVAVPKFEKDITNGNNKNKNTHGTNSFDPQNPASVIEDKPLNNPCNGIKDNLNSIGVDLTKHKKYANQPNYTPLLPASVVEEKEVTPKQLRDKTYSTRAKEGKDIFGNNDTRVKPFNYDPPNPSSVLEEKYTKDYLDNKQKTIGTGGSEMRGIFTKENIKKYNKENGVGFSPPNPASVLEEKTTYGISKEKAQKSGRKGFKGIGTQNVFDPPNPASVVEEKEVTYDREKYKEGDKGRKKGQGVYRINIPHKINNYDPPNPASVIEEDAESNKIWGYNKPDTFKINKNGTSQNFDPPNPASVVEEKEEKTTYGISKENCKNSIDESVRYNGNNFDPPNPASVVEDEPGTIFKSKKVFIGKRHHQTEKPLDILEFFLKYWSDEGDTILDPTMGSGSVGVACKKLNRNFIGYELDEKIFKVAEDRIAK